MLPGENVERRKSFSHFLYAFVGCEFWEKIMGFVDYDNLISYDYLVLL